MKRFLLPAAGALYLLAAPASAASDEMQRWHRAVDTLAQQNLQHVEDIELTLLGRFDVDALNERREELDVTIDGDGARVLSSRANGSIEDLADSLTLDQLRATLRWLEEGRYQRLEQISADDGLVDIEARNAEGRRVEITLNPGSMQLVSLEVQRLVDLD